MPIKLNGSTSGYVQIDAPAVAGTTQITLPATTGGSFIVSDASGNVAVGANLTLSGTAARITGDFSNATIANRVAFQSSTTNGASTLNIIPNGTSLTAGYNAFNAADPTNAGQLNAFVNGSEVSFRATIQGTGSYLPITFYTGGSERARIDTSGNIQVGGTTVANTVGYVNSRTNARAWVRWVGSTGAITAAYNVSSVTRNATGNYTINYTTALADANNAPIGMTAGATVYNSYGVYMNQNAAPTTTTCGIGTMSNSGVVVDCISNQLVVFGN